MTKNGKAIIEYMKTEGVLSGFADLLGDEREAKSNISSVLIAVRNDERLIKCDPESVYISGLRAATLRLSVDPSSHQAYLVAIKGRCELWVGYKGFYDMAIRTERYRYIQVKDVCEGVKIIEDRITGLHKWEGWKTSNERIGWFASFEMIAGYIKTIYMTIEEIHEYAKEHSPSYDHPKGIWKKNPKAMERKTILKILLMNWGYIAPSDRKHLAEYGDFEIDTKGIETELLEAKVIKKKTAEENIAELGYDNETGEITEDPKPWSRKALDRVLKECNITRDEAANELLDRSGLSYKATLVSIGKFAKWYQAGIDQDMRDEGAIEFAKANWQNGGNK